MDLFENEADLKRFVFRVTDNGGATVDRFTVVTNDGDYFAMSGHPFHPLGFGQTGEGYDPNAGQSRIDGKVERDIRWIDLPADCRRCVTDGLNRGFSDWLGAFVPPASRSDAQENGSATRLSERAGEGVYGTPGSYFVRIEGDRCSVDDPGPYGTVREAVLASLPDAHDLSGPEFHSGVDVWNVDGGASPLWNRTEEPPVLELENPHASHVLKDPEGIRVGWFASDEDARSHVDNLETEFHRLDPDGRFPKEMYVVLDIENDIH